MKRNSLPHYAWGFMAIVSLYLPSQSQALEVGFVLDPATSVMSFDYQAQVTMSTDVFNNGSLVASDSDTDTLTKHFSESASGTLSASYVDNSGSQGSYTQGALTYAGGTVTANYTGTPLTTSLHNSVLGVDIGLDIVISPISFEYGLPTFDGGSMLSTTSTTRVLGTPNVALDSTENFDASVTATVTGNPPQTETQNIQDTNSANLSLGSTLMLDGQGGLSGLSLTSGDSIVSTTTKPFSSNTDGTTTVTITFSSTETYSNMAVNFAPVPASPVPLPGTFVLMLPAFAGLFVLPRRRQG